MIKKLEFYFEISYIYRNVKLTNHTEISRICFTFAQFIFLPSTIHITMIFPPVATSSITANISDQKSFCHHGKSNGRS